MRTFDLDDFKSWAAEQTGFYVFSNPFGCPLTQYAKARGFTSKTHLFVCQDMADGLWTNAEGISAFRVIAKNNSYAGLSAELEAL